MKIRIRGNSIRYRLDKNDVELMETTGKVESSTHIGAGILHFCIRSREIEEAAIKLEGSSVHLSVPAAQIKNWIEPDQVGFDISIPNTDGSVVTILVEKDFKCLTERGEDDSHGFDNPMKNC
jgi:hypothetical protein